MVMASVESTGVTMMNQRNPQNFQTTPAVTMKELSWMMMRACDKVEQVSHTKIIRIYYRK